MAVVMIHGGAANEYEFIFTPDGPEEYPDLSKTDPEESASRRRAAYRVAGHSGVGDFAARPLQPQSLGRRLPNGVRSSSSAKSPATASCRNRLAVYTFRMCTEAIKALVEKNLKESIFMWGHSTGGEYFYLMEQYGLKNKLIGGLGFGTGMPAWVRKEWDLACAEKSPEERAAQFRNLDRPEPALAERLRQERLRRAEPALGQRRKMVRAGKSPPAAVQTISARHRAQRPRRA